MYKMITVRDIKSKCNLKAPPIGKRCFVIVNDTTKIEMVCRKVKGCTGGLVWNFICPVTGKRCRQLCIIKNRVVHRTLIKGYYTSLLPAWHTGTPFDRILKVKEGQIKSEKQMNRRYFKTHYDQKPTKRYLQCLRQIKAGQNFSMDGIINGQYDNQTI
jgi:hypothetical protein